MSSPFDDGTVRELDQPLDPSRVATMRGAKYLEGFDVIQRANEVFGYGAWGVEITKDPYCIEKGEQGQNNTPYEVWAAHIRLQIIGALPIEEIGTNVRQGKGADGLEMSIKGAVTDALKRAFHHYGNQFGLSLYDKSPEAQRPTQQARPQTQAQRGGSPATSPPVHPPAAAPNVDTRTGEIVDKPEWLGEFEKWRKANSVTPAEIEAIAGKYSVTAINAWIAGGDTRSINSLQSAILSARRVPA